nr:MAG TPA: hypothetical protein [Crassvirales sp.]
MEAWRIAIPIVVLILASIGAWYTVRLMRKEQRDRMYVYPKNGHQYMPLSRCRMKCPTSGEWFDALIYQDCNTKELYVMDRKNFLDKFIKLTEYNNGNYSKQRVSETD